MPLDTEGFTPLKDVTRAAFPAHGWAFPEKALGLSPRAEEALTGHLTAG
ncbi:hypothetical protein ACFVGY_14280 [Streptomyces sp. NPDC127106]